MIEVQLRPSAGGCLDIGLTVVTLGIFPVVRRMGEQHFIRSMDEAGIVTRGGRRVAWSEVQRIEQVVGKVVGATMSDELLLHTAQGRVSLPLWRAENAEAARAYLLAHLRGGV